MFLWARSRLIALYSVQLVRGWLEVVGKIVRGMSHFF